MKKIKHTLLIVLVVAFAIALVACSGGGTPAADTSGDDAAAADSGSAEAPAAAEGETLANPHRTYYYCGTLNSHPYFNDVYNGVKWAANAFGCDIIKVGPDTIDAVAQAEAIEQSIAKNPDGIITILYDATPLPAIEKAMAADIPVVVIEANVENNGAMAYCGADNIDYGKEVAKQLLAVADSGKLVVSGNWGATNTDDNLVGFEQQLEGSGWEILGKVDDKANSEDAIEAAKAALNNYPDMTALIGMDSSSGGGIVTALKELGYEPGEILVVCKDREDAILEGIQEGYITTAIANKSATMAYQAVLLLQAYNNFGMDTVPVTSDNKAAGVSPMSTNNFTGYGIITADNVEYFLADNIPVVDAPTFKE